MAKWALDDLQGAISDFTAASNEAPDHADFFIRRGQVHLRAEHFGEAADDFTRAIELSPDDAAVFHLRGTARLELDDLEGARDDLTTAIELDPTNKDALDLRATAWERLGALDKAELDRQRIAQTPSLDRRKGTTMRLGNKHVYELVRKHFSPMPLDNLSITERRFPMRVRADLQRAVDRLLLTPFLTADRNRVRRAAVRSIGRLAPDDYREALAERLKDDSPGVSREAARSLFRKHSNSLEPVFREHALAWFESLTR